VRSKGDEGWKGLQTFSLVVVEWIGPCVTVKVFMNWEDGLCEKMGNCRKELLLSQMRRTPINSKQVKLTPVQRLFRRQLGPDFATPCFLGAKTLQNNADPISMCWFVDQAVCSWYMWYVCVESQGMFLISKKSTYWNLSLLVSQFNSLPDWLVVSGSPDVCFHLSPNWSQLASASSSPSCFSKMLWGWNLQSHEAS